ncbi:vWA domain-containing protein [Actinoplanes sp. NPDC049668]|uniref:vWA domain-containing protein n=1 Tax=unclassified Actinoplanes TaxID=2626549 RepID=UPI0033A4CAF7
MRRSDGPDAVPPAAAGALSRRSFLVLTTALSAAALTGCGLFDSDEKDLADSDVPFGLWQQLRTAVRTSPDHVAAAAERVVAGKDPEAILGFVRDQIIVYPSLRRPDLVDDSRWGVRGTLRGGAGSARDKAETLAELYRRAGFQAEVVAGKLADDVDIMSIFRPVRRPFAPTADEDSIDGWRKAIGTQPTSTAADRAAAVRDDLAARADLARQLSAALPSRRAADVARPRDRRVPLVKVMVNGREVFANPLVPGARLGASHTTDQPLKASRAQPGTSVTVRLLAATTAEPGNPKPLVEAEYRADDLVGRQLLVAFRPTTEMAQLIHLRAQDLNTFIPVLAVSGPGLSAEAAAELAHSGPAISLSGQVIEAKAGAVLVDGEELDVPAEADPRAGDRVAKLEVDVAGGAFPDIALRVSALDSTGKPVTGLPASAFRLAEGETKLALRMTANRQRAPRVMLVFDRSGSIKSGPEPVAFATELATRLFARHPDAVLGVGSVSGTSERGFTLRSPQAVGAAVGKLSSFGSKVWDALATAGEQGPTVIVIASDFQDDETDAERVAALRSRVASGVPVVAIGIGDVDTATQAQIAELTGGVATKGSDVDRTVAAADAFLRRRETAPYQLRYRAPADGPAERTVKLTTGRGVTATGSYRVPPAEKRTAGSAFAGFYLGVRVGYESEVIRVLAGVDLDQIGFADPVPASAVEEVRGLMFGSTLVSFEGAAPSLGTWLDDLLTARIGAKPYWDAVFAADEQRVVAALADGLPFLPSTVPALHPPMPADGDLTFETGLRAVLHVDRPQFGAGRVRRADVLPCTRWATLGGDRVRAFDRTLEASAALATAEGSAFETSTRGALNGKRLTLLPKGSLGSDDLAFLPEDSRAQWRALLDRWDDHDRLVPADGTPVAFWAVDPDTGSVLGVLADGSGGGATVDVECQIFAEKAALSMLGIFGGMLGIGALGVFASLGKAISAQMLRYAHVIENLDQPNVAELAQGATDAFWDEAKGVLADVIKPPVLGAAGGLILGKDLAGQPGNIDGWLDVMGLALPVPGLTEFGSGPPSC